MIKVVVFLFLSAALPALSQGLFESALQESRTGETTAGYELNGYVRGVFYGGKVYDGNEYEMKSGYGEAALKLRVRKGSFGDAYAELRFRSGAEYNQDVNEVLLREGYVDAYVGPFDFRLGQQIIVWGRADGFNPTNNLMPYNFLARSPAEDDRRVGNFLLRSRWNWHVLRVEANWIPRYKPTIIPFDAIPLPVELPVAGPLYPDARLQNSSVGLKADVELAAFDGSISWFDGYTPLPGIDAEIDPAAGDPQAGFSVRLRAYRQKVVGADFSTTVGSFSLRGEAAYRSPYDDYQAKAYVPNPDVQVILGADRQFGDFSVLMQYMGRHVIDFTEAPQPDAGQDPLASLRYEMEMKNRMLAQQLFQTSHALSGRVSYTMLHETLMLELFGMVNFTTEEYLARPMLSYDMTDALKISIGGEYYGGPKETLYGAFGDVLSAAFVELRVSF